MHVYEVHVGFAVTVQAEDEDAAVDAAHAYIASSDFRNMVKDTGLDVFDISWKDVHQVESEQ